MEAKTRLGVKCRRRGNDIILKDISYMLNLCTHGHTHTDTHMHTYTQTYTHTHTHTHTHTPELAADPRPESRRARGRMFSDPYTEGAYIIIMILVTKGPRG